MNSDPAFPVSTSDGMNGHQDGDDTWQFSGMSLRDYFAAKAMNNMIVSWVQTGVVDPDDYPNIARHSYEMADAMLKAREA